MIVTLPDGTELDMPDDISDENRKRAVRMHRIRSGQEKAIIGPESLRRSAQEEVEARDPNLWTKFWTGSGVRAREMSAGLQSPFKDLSPEQQSVLDMSRKVRDAEGPMANLGSMAADIGVSALPLAKAAMLGTKAPAAAALLRAAPKVLPRIAATGAVGAGLGAALTPDNRMKAAAVGTTAALSPAMGAANSALRAKGILPGKNLMQTIAALKKIPNKLQALNTVGMGGVAGHAMGLPIGSIAGAAMGPAAGGLIASEASRAFPEAMPGLFYGASEEMMR